MEDLCVASDGMSIVGVIGVAYTGIAARSSMFGAQSGASLYFADGQ